MGKKGIEYRLNLRSEKRYICSMKMIFTVLFATVFTAQGICQENTGLEAYQSFWNKVDTEYKDPEHSPLKPADIAGFDSIARFDFDQKYRVMAHWKETKREKPIKFKTSSTKVKTYQKVADLVFVLDGDTLSLSAFQNLELMRNPMYKDYVFVPFTDDSNGFETYGGGRYLDFDRPQSDSLIVDFNHTYNPYCAYSDGYSCPIPPKENNLKVSILAGAKAEKK